MPDKEGHPSPQEMDLGQVLAALADPWRRQVVRELAAAPDGTARTCASFALPMAKATRTHHFRVLREAGLIHQEDCGNARLTRLRRADIDRRFPGLLGLVAAETPQPPTADPQAAPEGAKTAGMPASRRRSALT